MSGDRRTEERRQPAERRARGDRKSDLRQPAIEICHSMLHLAIAVQGKGAAPDCLLTRSIRWRKSASRLAGQEAARELTDALQQLVTEERLAGTSARLVLNGDLSVTRVSIGTTAEVRRDLAELHDRSQLYLALGPGKKAFAESIIPVDARHSHGLLTVANRSTIELVMDACDRVGLKLERIESSLVSLSRLVGTIAPNDESASILLELDEDRAEIGVCRNGQLLLDYRPAAKTTAAEIAIVLCDHLHRLERYCQRRLNLPKCELRRVYVTGAPEKVASAIASINRSPTLRAQEIEISGTNLEDLHCERMPTSELSAVIGAALVGSRDPKSIVSPNLIDYVLAAKRMPLKPVLVRLAIPLAAVLFVAIGLWAYNYNTGSKLASMRNQLTELAPTVARANELRLQAEVASARAVQLESLASAIPESHSAIALERVRTNMPDEVWLDRLTIRDNLNAILVGASYSESSVYDFVKFLEQVPEVEQVALQGTGIDELPTGAATSYDLSFQLRNSNASGIEGQRP